MLRKISIQFQGRDEGEEREALALSISLRGTKIIKIKMSPCNIFKPKILV